jgi:periplasmic protein TonB
MKDNGLRNLLRFIFQSKTQPSLFHYVKETPDASAFEDLDWSFLRHPIRSFKEWWRSPRTKPSLFHYVEEDAKTPFSWKEFWLDFFTGFKNPIFIPSVFSDLKGLAVERAQGRTRKMEAGMVSLFIHAAILGAIIFIISESPKPTAQKDDVVYVNNPIFLPPGGDGRDGGGGGGGGKNQAGPPATGALPQTTRVQMIAPDPTNPQPLMPADDLIAQVPSIQMPIDLPRNTSLPIGDILAPPNGSISSGSGSGGGIGTGQGTGIGSGRGAGVGPGSGGGMGGGSDGGIGKGVGPYIAGDGVNAPIVLLKTKPPYTEEARKAHATGIVSIQAVIREDGTIDSFKVLRGLGYGLDEAAITTVSTKWRFKPGTKNGAPVPVIVNIEVEFNLF